MEELLDTLSVNTRVRTSGEDLFSISYEGSEPSKTRDVVQALITLFVEGNLGQNREDMDAAADFLDRQIGDYEAKLQEAEQRAAEFKRVNMALLPGQNGYNARLERARLELVSLQSELEEAETQSAIIESELSTIPAFVEVPKGEGPPLSF